MKSLHAVHSTYDTVELNIIDNAGDRYQFNVKRTQFAKYVNGSMENIQDIFPDLEPAYRELFISGFGPKAWNKMFDDIEE